MRLLEPSEQTKLRHAPHETDATMKKQARNVRAVSFRKSSVKKTSKTMVSQTSSRRGW